MDGSVRVFNLRENIDATQKGQSDLHAENLTANAWKLDFSPDGSEILTG